ncbi:hypothetical protein C0991_001418 [Blastosporella zonata]|nr:hypothetical protein C0991_001418 [Blastosporella zonata]
MSDYSQVFTITLEVVLHRIDDRFRAELEPRREINASTSLRVAYDGTFPVKSGSVVNFFESNVSFRDFDQDMAGAHTVFRLRGPPRGVPAYSARILPVSRRPISCVANLPPSILQSIARAAVDHRVFGWRSKLMSIGSVCKAWTCMLDVFLVLLTRDTSTSDPPAPLAVARLLKLKPECGKLICCFRLEDYAGLSKGIDNEVQFISRCRAILTILSSARTIKRIHLPGIHKSLQEDFVQILSRLECVEHCTIYDHDSHMGKIAEFTVGEIQQFIANWIGLRQLEIAFRTIVSTRAFDDEVPELQCRIVNLRLRTSHLTGRQFVRFTSSRLRKVELERLIGPLNRDLLSFLSAAAPSLTSLTIRSCTFLRQTMHEEYAIDAVMHQLCALEELAVSGDILTARAIAEKAPAKHSSSPVSFTATLAPALYIDDLPESLETSGWNIVTIRALPGFMDDTDLWMKQQALEIAARRNIIFTYGAVC